MCLHLHFRDKIDQIVEIVTGNPTVIKMVVHFNRYARPISLPLQQFCVFSIILFLLVNAGGILMFFFCTIFFLCHVLFCVAIETTTVPWKCTYIFLFHSYYSNRILFSLTILYRLSFNVYCQVCYLMYHVIFLFYLISYLFRGAKGQSSLRDILQPLVKEVLTDKNLTINTNPVEVYKQWINQMETETGQQSDLPYDVDNDFAMKQPEVAKRVSASIKGLSAAADKFLNSFIKSIDKIP